MSTLIQPLTLLVVAIAGWVQRDQQAAIVYLLEHAIALVAAGDSPEFVASSRISAIRRPVLKLGPLATLQASS